MKLQFLYIFLITSLLSASDIISNTEALSKKEMLSQYTKALKLYKQKKYQEAYTNFNALFETNLDDVNINFYLGRSAFALKKYDDAIVAFDRVLFSNPDSTRTKLEIARAYFMSKQYGEAKKYFIEVKNDPKAPQKIKEVVSKFLASIDKNTKKNFLNGVVLFGLNYDANVKNTPKMLNNTTPNTDPTFSDVAHQEVLILNHKYNMGDTKVLKNDLMLFKKEFNDKAITDQNVKLISYTPAYNKTYKNGLIVDYAIFGDMLWLDDEKNMKSYGIFPKLTYPINKKLIVQAHLKGQKKLYEKATDKRKNSLYFELSLGSKYLYTSTTTFGATVVATQERKIDDNQVGIDVDKNSYQVKFNSTYLFAKKYSLAPSISLKTTLHKDQNPLNNNQRQKDNEYKFALMGTYIYSPQWLFQLGVDYTKVISNLEASQYHKHTFTFNVIRPF